MNFNTIYSQHFDAIFSTALKYVHGEDADDATAHAFISYWRNRDKVEVGKERAYLVVVAINKAKDILRGKKTKKEVSVCEWMDVYEYTTYDKDREYLLSKLLPLAIEKLAPVSRKIVRLLLQGYESGEIALLLGTAPPTVYNQKNSAIKVLRKHLRPHL